MKLGGIDPSILRELSGVYKPFVKAFKELVSNSFDADADVVRVAFSDDFSTVAVTDDGQGMTPFEFRTDFARIGGGSRRWAGDRTRKGRLRIGSKGIGFLALARYCDRLWVESGAARPFEATVDIPEGTASFDLDAFLGVPMPHALLSSRLTCQVRHRGSGKLKEGADYRWNAKGTRLAINKAVGPVTLKARVDCSGLRFRASLDFGRLLQLADHADLEKIEDFAAVEVFEAGTHESTAGTTITAEQLKPFVRRELRAERRKGFVRNVSSRSGFEQFNWALSRCAPVPYAPQADTPNPAVLEQLAPRSQATLSSLVVTHGSESTSLSRPVYPLEPGSPVVPADMLVAVAIDEGGLHAVGCIAGFEGVIFPAEYRGLSIRVRGVSIGDPGYLGADTLLTGASKAALSQITGEIVVLSGLDAVDTLNPGRESFYEESEQYKVLRKHLLGEGERVSGYHGGVAEACRVVREKLPEAQIVLLGQSARLLPKLVSDSCAAHLVVTKPVALPDVPAALDLYGSDTPQFLGLRLDPRAAIPEVRAAVDRGVHRFTFFEDDICRDGGGPLREIFEKTKDFHRHLRYHFICGLDPAKVTPAVAAVIADRQVAEAHFEEAGDGNEIDIEVYRRVRAYIREAGLVDADNRLSGFVWIGRPREELDKIVLRSFNVLNHLEGLILKPYSPTPGSPNHRANEAYLAAIPTQNWSPHFFPFAELNGITRGEYHDLYRMAAFLNEKVRDVSFDFLKGTLGSQMLRESLRKEVWKLEPSPLRVVD